MRCGFQLEHPCHQGLFSPPRAEELRTVTYRPRERLVGAAILAAAFRLNAARIAAPQLLDPQFTSVGNWWLAADDLCGLDFLPRNDRSSSADRKTSSIDSTRWNSIFSRTSGGSLRGRVRSPQGGHFRDVRGPRRGSWPSRRRPEAFSAQSDLAGHRDVAVKGNPRDRRERERWPS